MRYEEVTKSRRAAYNGGEEARDRSCKEPWKLAEHATLLDRQPTEAIGRCSRWG